MDSGEPAKKKASAKKKKKTVDSAATAAAPPVVDSSPPTATNTSTTESPMDDNDDDSMTATTTTTPEQQQQPSSIKKAAAAKRKSSPGTATFLNKSYIQLVQEAIMDMKDRTGSSLPALKQWIISNYPDLGGPHFNSRLNKALRNGLTSKPPKIIKTKGSYKLPTEFKEMGKKRKTPATAASKTDTTATTAAAGKAVPTTGNDEAAKRAEMFRKRNYPMEDTKLHAQDKEFRIRPSAKPRPSLPYFWQVTLPHDHPHRSGKTPNPILAGSRVDNPLESRGLVPDLLQVYHFFRGDVHFALDNEQQVVPKFSLRNLIFAVEQVLNGNTRKCKQIPPLLVHLFVTCLQLLLSGEGLTSSRAESNLYTELHTFLDPVLTPSNWADVTHLYMDAVERYFSGTTSEAPVPELGFEVAPPASTTLCYLGEGILYKAHHKLGEKDPWFLSAEELMALLRALTEDVLALFPDMLDEREEKLQALASEKRSADNKLRKVRLAFEGPKKKKPTGKKETDAATETTLDNREKPFKPTATRKQFELAKKAQEKAVEAYENALGDSLFVSRTEPIGHDRHHNAVYSFAHDPDLVFVEDRRTPSRLPQQPERRMWHVIETTKVFDAFVASLDARGRREHSLKQAMEPIREHLADDTEEKKQKLKEAREALEQRLQEVKARYENDNGDRLTRSAEEELKTAQQELDKFEEANPAPEEDVSFDYMELTGLEVLREFEEGDSARSRRSRHNKATEAPSLKIPLLYCSKLSADDTGMVGLLVADILNLEEHCEAVVPWTRNDKTRAAWISKVKGAVDAWNSISPLLLGLSDAQSNVYSGADPDTPNSKRRKLDSSTASGSSEKVSSILGMLRQPLLDLEERVADITNVALATRDADLADDNISIKSDPAVDANPVAEEWKKLTNKFINTPSRKRHAIRPLLVAAIGAARKAHLPDVVSQLRSALLLYHPAAPGTCRKTLIKILDEFGGYEEDDDDASDDEADEPEDAVPSVLSAEAVILRSSLTGSEDAKREDWVKAVRCAKTLSRFASLSAGFVHDAMAKIEKLEIERHALFDALGEWKKEKVARDRAGGGKKGGKSRFEEPSEVWTPVDYTDEICMAKAEDYPWWPARKCVPKDEVIADKLFQLDRCIVAFVGEMGGLRVVKLEDQLQPFTGEMVQEPDAVYSKSIRNTLDECMTMARRLLRGIQKTKPRVVVLSQQK